MTRYAEGTTVSVERTQMEIRQTVARYGAKRFLMYEEDSHAVVMFEIGGWRIQFRLSFPTLDAFKLTPGGQRRSGQQMESARSAEIMRLWRSLGMVIKAKLESVASGIETYEQAFMANIVLPGGTTVGDWLTPQLEQSYRDNALPPMLGSGKG